MLTISHYTKTYPGGKTAVEDLSLHVPAGELCGFIGHNGAGKTTTLRAAAGDHRHRRARRPRRSRSRQGGHRLSPGQPGPL